MNKLLLIFTTLFALQANAGLIDSTDSESAFNFNFSVQPNGFFSGSSNPNNGAKGGGIFFEGDFSGFLSANHNDPFQALNDFFDLSRSFALQLLSGGFAGCHGASSLCSFSFGFTSTNAANSGSTAVGGATGPASPAINSPVKVPEPGSMALLGVGLIGLSLARRQTRIKGNTLMEEKA